MLLYTPKRIKSAIQNTVFYIEKHRRAMPRCATLNRGYILKFFAYNPTKMYPYASHLALFPWKYMHTTVLT